jgi:preprotein translocase subunit SecF
VLARRSSAARQTGAAPVAGPVASARRGRRPAAGAGTAVAELPDVVPADVVVESPSSVRPEASGATVAPRPGARPQRPGGNRPGKKRR